MKTIFYRSKRLFALTIFMMLAAGASAFLTIGRQEDPAITNLFATLVTPYPGADPEQVESLVTEKIENELREIPEIKSIESTSRSGISIITVELSQFITDTEIEQAWSEIRDALSDAALLFPEGVPDSTFDNDRTGAFTAISAILPKANRTGEAAAAMPVTLRRYAEILQDRLRGVGGTKFVRLFGDQREEIQVTIDAQRLASLGLRASDVSTAIRNADAKVRAGQVRGSQSDLLIEVEGEFKSVDRIREIPVRDDGGRVVRVRDVASVDHTVSDPPDSIALIDGSDGILIAARMEDDLQVAAWAAKVEAVYADFAATLPASIEHRKLFDQSTYTADRLAGVVENMAVGVAIVLVVLLFTLGWRAALIVGSVLPLASIGSIAALQFSGVPIHQMSVTGLIVALGLLVDAAIVMVDEVRKRLEAGDSRLEAVDGAVTRLTFPLLASTATTVLAFMPMLLLPGPAGDFVGSIATAVIAMLVVSFFLALTTTPALAGWLLKQPKHDALGANDTPRPAKRPSLLVRAFSGSLDLSLRHPVLSILAALALPVIGFGTFPTLKPQFFPGVDRNQFHVQMKLPDGTAIQETRRQAEVASQLIRSTNGIASIQWVVGESAPAFYYNMLADQDNNSAYAEALVTTTSPETTEAIMPDLQRLLDAELPAARITVRGLVQGPPVRAPVELRIVGPDTTTLRRVGDEVRAIMLEVPDILQARTQIVSGAPKVSVALSEEKVRLAGLNLADVASQLENTLEGATGGSLIAGTEELPVRVRVGDAGRDGLNAVRALTVLPPLGAQVGAGSAGTTYPGIPIAALGEVRMVPAEAPVYRRNGERINTVQAFVHRDALPEASLQRVQARLAEAGYELPPGYRFELGGDTDARDETLRNMLSSAGIIVALTIATIVLTFGSYRMALIAGVVAILSVGLSVLALAIFQYPFGIMPIIGVIGSIGVSINAAIIIITSLQQDPGALAGDIGRMRDVVLSQSRHIVSTTITTFGGFLPLILEGGGFWPPFAMAIAGGVLLSTIVSFYFVPPAFRLLATKSLPSGFKFSAEPSPAASV